MTSKAQVHYAEQITRFFADLDTAAVLADMDTWTDRHQAAKNGHPYLDDTARTAATTEIRRLAAVTASAEDAHRRATGILRDARARRLAPEDVDTARDAARQARQHLADVRSAARRGVADLAEQLGHAHEYEIQLIAGRAGLL